MFLSRVKSRLYAKVDAALTPLRRLRLKNLDMGLVGDTADPFALPAIASLFSLPLSFFLFISLSSLVSRIHARRVGLKRIGKVFDVR